MSSEYQIILIVSAIFMGAYKMKSPFLFQIRAGARLSTIKISPQWNEHFG